MRQPDIHERTIEPLARAACDRGGRAYIVGGWVRDRLLGLPSKDIDLEVFGIRADDLYDLLRQFGHVEAVGVQFPVYKLFPDAGGEIDVAMPRRESKSGVGHRGFDVQGDHTMTLAEAVHRRDFTINAIAWDPLTEDYVDVVNGQNDILHGMLRVVNPATFGDDSLRVLRGVQFAARFGFDMHIDTEAICRAIDLTDLPAERIWGEFEKLLKAPKPSVGLQLARDLGVFRQLFPELQVLKDTPQDPTWHPEGDVWTHTLMVVDQARMANDDLLTHDYPRFVTMMLAALLHDVGKPSTTAMVNGRWHAHDHEAVGVEPARRVLNGLNIHTIDGFDVRHHVLALVEQHLKPMLFHKDRAGVGAFRRLARKVDMDLLARMADADITGRGGDTSRADEIVEWFATTAMAHGVEKIAIEPLLKGRHLIDMGMRPGPMFGKILDAVYELQMDGSITTLDEAKAIVAVVADSGCAKA